MKLVKQYGWTRVCVLNTGFSETVDAWSNALVDADVAVANVPVEPASFTATTDSVNSLSVLLEGIVTRRLRVVLTLAQARYLVQIAKAAFGKAMGRGYAWITGSEAGQIDLTGTRPDVRASLRPLSPLGHLPQLGPVARDALLQRSRS